MKRIVMSVVLTSAVLTMLAISATAQTTDFSEAEITATKITENFYTLTGLYHLPASRAPRATIGALVGPDGVLLVDANFAPLTENIVAAIRTISDGPIRFLINTHFHGDHTGGNENFGKMGVMLFSRDQLRHRLAYPNPRADGTPRAPAPAVALPVVTYNGRVTLHLNGETVEAIPIPAAHTDGDTLVRFPNSDILMTGDYFRSYGYPRLYRGHGGSLQGLVDGLGVTIGLCGPNTKVIPGHGEIVDRSAVTAQRDLILVMRDRVAQLVKRGETLEEVVAAKLTSDFDAHVPGAAATSEQFVGWLYGELKDSQ